MREYILLLLGLLIIAGCAGGPRDAPYAGSTRSIEQWVALHAESAPPKGAAATLLPEQESVRLYVRTEGARSKTDVRFHMLPRGEREWIFTIEGRSRAVYRMDDAGAVRVVREEDFGQNAAVTYEPGLLVLPADLSVRGVSEGESGVTVHDLTGTRLRDRGRVRYRVEVLGQGGVDTPAGIMDAVMVATARTMELGMARVRLDTLRAWRPGAGIVAEHTLRQVQAMGFVRTRLRTLLERAE